jgi:hypothetical protein
MFVPFVNGDSLSEPIGMYWPDDGARWWCEDER